MVFVRAFRPFVTQKSDLRWFHWPNIEEKLPRFMTRIHELESLLVMDAAPMPGECFGAHAGERGRSVPGYYFRVWAPNAQQVCVFGDFNDWDPNANPLDPCSGRHLGGVHPRPSAAMTRINMQYIPRMAA